MPVISQVASLTVDGDSVTGKRQTEHGYDSIRSVRPAVVAVSDAINEPRYPSLKGIMGAKSKPQESLGLAELGVEAGLVGESGAKTTVLGLAPPPSRGSQVKIEDDGSAAGKILEYVTERRLL
jgi:electron transfer flavoprotein beta subunit